MGTYVTDTGFQKKTLSEIKSELEIQFQEIFGNDIDLDESGPFGQMIGIQAKGKAELWDALEEIYSCRNPLQATGICLDMIVAENNITRQAATATTANDVLLLGDEGTIVIAGKKVKQSTNSLNYELDNAVTITKTAANKGVVSVDSVTIGNTYTVTINSTDYSYVAVSGDDADAILTEIQTLISAGTWTGSGSVSDSTLILYYLTTSFSFSVTGDLTIDEIWTTGNFTCEETGSNTLPANTLVNIVTPVTGWLDVINPSAGVTGTNTETDDQLRLRRSNSIIQGSGTDEAIRSAIANNIDGVTSVAVTSNRTDSVDSESRPAHSFEAVVEGGDDDEVANEIWRVQPSGIQSYGNTTIDVEDSQGETQTINFSRPENVYIYLKVKRSLYSEETYPTNGDELIKENIVNWSLLRNNINIGTNVILQRLGTPIYGVPNTDYPVIAGIEDIEVTIDYSTTLPYTPTYTSSNVPIDGRQIAVFSTDRIVVESL